MTKRQGRFNRSIGTREYGVAITNPKFEYWLLLHFDEGNDVQTAADCVRRLKRYLPNFEKNNLGFNYLESKWLISAISNAKKRHKQCQDWYTDNHSTVHLLIEKILNEENKELIHFRESHHLGGEKFDRDSSHER